MHRGLDFTPSLVRASCDLSGWFQLGRKGARRQVSERRVRPFFVVVDPPVGDALTGVSHRQEAGPGGHAGVGTGGASRGVGETIGPHRITALSRPSAPAHDAAGRPVEAAIAPRLDKS